jgi:hypothetical protein
MNKKKMSDLFVYGLITISAILVLLQIYLELFK